jgi:hypothetical protein
MNRANETAVIRAMSFVRTTTWIWQARLRNTGWSAR